MSKLLQQVIANAGIQLQKFHDVVYVVSSGKGFDIELPEIDEKDVQNGKKITFVDLIGAVTPGTPIRIIPNAGDGSLLTMLALTEIVLDKKFQYLTLVAYAEAGRGGVRWVIDSEFRLQHHKMTSDPVLSSESWAAIFGTTKKYIGVPTEYDGWWINSVSYTMFSYTGGTSGDMKLRLIKKPSGGAFADIAASESIIPFPNLFGNTQFREQVLAGDIIDVKCTGVPAGGAVARGLVYTIFLTPY